MATYDDEFIQQLKEDVENYLAAIGQKETQVAAEIEKRHDIAAGRGKLQGAMNLAEPGDLSRIFNGFRAKISARLPDDPQERIHFMDGVMNEAATFLLDETRERLKPEIILAMGEENYSNVVKEKMGAPAGENNPPSVKKERMAASSLLAGIAYSYSEAYALSAKARQGILQTEREEVNHRAQEVEKKLLGSFSASIDERRLALLKQKALKGSCKGVGRLITKEDVAINGAKAVIAEFDQRYVAFLGDVKTCLKDKAMSKEAKGQELLRLSQEAAVLAESIGEINLGLGLEKSKALNQYAQSLKEPIAQEVLEAKTWVKAQKAEKEGESHDKGTFLGAETKKYKQAVQELKEAETVKEAFKEDSDLKEDSEDTPDAFPPDYTF